MRLVVDTNILFSFFRENPVRSIIINAQLIGLDLYTPEFAIEELKVHKKDLVKYTKVHTTQQLDNIFELLPKYVKTIPLEVYVEEKEQGKKISPDPKDSPFFSLALKLNAHIWSNEPRLKKQTSLNVYSTRAIMALVKNKI